MAVNWTYEYYCTRLGVKFVNGDHFILKGKAYTSAYTNSASLGYDFSNEPTEKIFYGVASDPNYPEKIGYPILFCKVTGAQQYYIQDSAIYQNVSGTQMNYTLTLNANGGTANSNGSSLTVTLNSQNYNAISSWLPSRTGYQLQGMYNASSGGTKVYNANGSITNDGTYWSNNVWIYKGNVTLYAQWKGNTYYVKYDKNHSSASGSMSNSTHTYGTASSLTKNAFTRQGHTFKGWAKSSSGSKALNDQYSVTDLTTTNGGTVTLYAVWEANKYTVSFNSQGGSSCNAVTVTYGGTYGTLPTPTRTGYTFNGWYNAASGGTKITSTSTVSITANQTLYAQWTGYSYQVRYNANGGSGTMSNSSHRYGTASNLTANAFTRTGYTFQGWATTSSGSKAYNNQHSVTDLTSTNNGVVDLYAVWTINQYTLTINPDGGLYNGSSSNSTVKQNYNTTYTLSTPTKTGYTFKSWSKASGGGSLSGSTYTFGSSDGTVKASWTIKTSTVTINANGGTWSGTTPVTQNYGTTLTLANPTRTDYTFKGWRLTGGGAGVNISGSTFTFGEENATLTATWENNTNNIYFYK